MRPAKRYINFLHRSMNFMDKSLEIAITNNFVIKTIGTEKITYPFFKRLHENFINLRYDYCFDFGSTFYESRS